MGVISKVRAGSTVICTLDPYLSLQGSVHKPEIEVHQLLARDNPGLAHKRFAFAARH